jgi:hypothetical protein
MGVVTLPATAAAMVVVAPASTSRPVLAPEELELVEAELDDPEEEAPLLVTVELPVPFELDKLEVEVELALWVDELVGAADEVDDAEEAPLLDELPVDAEALGAKHVPPLQTLSPPQSALV